MAVYYYTGDYLAHHGIKGQKWGIRKYQNEDGTLTAAGKERYGKLGEYDQQRPGLIRRLATGDHVLGSKRWLGDRAEASLYKQAERARQEGDKKRAAETKKYADAQRQANIDRDKYISKTSTGKLIAQNFLMGSIGADSYRVARQRGESRIAAAIPGILANVPYVGGVAAIGANAYKNKKAYGRIVY